jgi:hypothetical protein
MILIPTPILILIPRQNPILVPTLISNGDQY